MSFVPCSPIPFVPFFGAGCASEIIPIQFQWVYLFAACTFQANGIFRANIKSHLRLFGSPFRPSCSFRPRPYRRATVAKVSAPPPSMFYTDCSTVYRKALPSDTNAASPSVNRPKLPVQPVAQPAPNPRAYNVFSLPTPSSMPVTPSRSTRSNGAAMSMTPTLSPPPSYKPIVSSTCMCIVVTGCVLAVNLILAPRKLVVISDSESEPSSPSPRPEAHLERLPPMPIHARQLDVPERPASPLGEPILQQSSAEMQARCDAVEAELFASLRRLVISDQPRNRGPSSPVDDPDPAPPYYVVNPPPEFSRTARTFYVVCHGRRCGVYTDW